MMSMVFKILKTFFKVSLVFVTALLLLASVYVAYNTPLTL